MSEAKKAVGSVIIRHTCDGVQIADDQVQRRLVHIDRHGRYHIWLYARRWPVTRITGTREFICEFAGRTR